MKIRVNWSIEKIALEIVERISRERSISISNLISELILQKLRNPMEIAKEDLKKTWIAYYAAKEKVKELELGLPPRKIEIPEEFKK